jgi:hypothetical protein
LAGPKKCRPTVKRKDAERSEQESAKRSERAREISTAARVVIMAWEIVWTLVRDHMSRGTGPGPLL